ncbi:mucin-5AC-like [Haliotis rubra]|uniref:mucin-5AC-like n=1 Tax=Haliotis rubra TaxID=36100 RepID=UPI001EE60F95|nr:mucin-5AC-like [Haliotis rubra]
MVCSVTSSTLTVNISPLRIEYYHVCIDRSTSRHTDATSLQRYEDIAIVPAVSRGYCKSPQLLSYSINKGQRQGKMVRNTIALFISAVAWVQSDSLMGKHYYMYQDFRTWNEARTICEDIGGRLAQIDNQQTLDGLLAYAKTNQWKDVVLGHFWIGLNRVDQEQGYRWDHCEGLDHPSFTFWDASNSQDATKHCVYAERDTLRWFNEVCDSSSYQYLCQKEGGPCTYTEFSGACLGSGHDETSVVADVDVAQCEDLCSSTLEDELACWMYSYESPNCTLYFDDNPWACSKPPTNTTAKTRACFTFQSLTSSSSVSDSNSKPNINCDLYTTQASDTSTSRTTSPPTTATSPTTPDTASVTMATDATAKDIASITMATDASTKDTASITKAIDPTIPDSESGSMATDATTLDTASTTMATLNTTLDSASVTMAADATPQDTLNITVATTPASTPTTVITTQASLSTATLIAPSTTQNVTTSSTSSSQTTIRSTTATTTFGGNSSGNSDTCPCLVCVVAKNTTEIQNIVDAILRLLKMDKSKLSATRRKLNSEPDDRPSAQAFGYSGILFIVITVSFFVLVDLIRLCQYIADTKVGKTDEGQR